MDATLERFFTHVDVGLCWLWTASKRRGYGQFSVGGRPVIAHRWLWTQLVGPLADDLVLDHLCRVTACCNPDHLDPVTQAVNQERSRLGYWQRIETRRQRQHAS